MATETTETYMGYAAGIPERITVDWLRQHRACKGQLKRFIRLFGADGADLTPATITTAAEGGLDIVWLFNRTCTMHEWSQFWMAMGPACAQLNRDKANERDEAPTMIDYQRAAAVALIGVLWPDRSIGDEGP